MHPLSTRSDFSTFQKRWSRPVTLNSTRNRKRSGFIEARRGR